MDTPHRLGPDATIAQWLDARPDTIQVFRAHGIDACCGGALTLRQAAEVRGIPLETLRAALVPPPGGSCPMARMRPAIVATEVVHPPFIRAALGSTLTLGATFGALNLLWVHFVFGPLPPSHHQAHARFQLWGFVLLFIMGIAYHALPRFLATPLRGRRLVPASLWMSLAGLLLVGYGHLAPAWPGALTALLSGNLLLLAGTAAWAAIVLATWWPARSAGDPSQPFLVAGTLWWLAAAGGLLAGAVLAVTEGHPDASAAWNEPVYAAALFGGTLAWIQGMALRTLPTFLSLPPTRQPAVRGAFALGQAGALLALLGAVTIGRPGSILLSDGGLLALSLAVLLFAWGLRPFTGRGPGLILVEPGFARTIRLAFLASLLFAFLATGYAVSHLLDGPAPRLLLDGARHAFTAGFVTLMILGMARRVVPAFSGTRLRWPRAHDAGTWLIAIAVLLRQAQVGAALVDAPWLMFVSGASGLVAATGVTLAGASILGTLCPAAHASPAGAPSGPIGVVPGRRPATEACRG